MGTHVLLWALRSNWEYVAMVPWALLSAYGCLWVLRSAHCAMVSCLGVRMIAHDCLCALNRAHDYSWVFVVPWHHAHAYWWLLIAHNLSWALGRVIKMKFQILIWNQHFFHVKSYSKHFSQNRLFSKIASSFAILHFKIAKEFAQKYKGKIDSSVFCIFCFIFLILRVQ